MIIYIYILIDPRTNEVRYVGQTKNPNKRLKGHIKSPFSKAKSFKLNKTKSWIKQLSRYNNIPIMEIVHECTLLDWQFWEKHYVSLYKSWNFKLTNDTEGGDGIYGYKFSEEYKNKRSKLYSGKGNPFFNKTHTETTRKILSDKSSVNFVGEGNPMFGKIQSDKSKKKMSLKKQGLYDSGNNPRALKMNQYDLKMNLIKEWMCVKDAAKFYNVSYGILGRIVQHNSALEEHNTRITNNINEVKGYIIHEEIVDDLIIKLQNLQKQYKKYKILNEFIFKYA